MKAIAVSGIVLFALLLSRDVVAKGATTRISIRDRVTNSSVDITDRAVLDRFIVWSGPGTFSRVARGPEVEGQDGFIIDWPAGIVVNRPAGLHRHEVRFYCETPNSTTERLAYVVYYEHDAQSKTGFIYLPSRSEEYGRLNSSTIERGHGYEGHWFRATAAWQNAVHELLAR
jgi:hypothetical protein